MYPFALREEEMGRCRGTVVFFYVAILLICLSALATSDYQNDFDNEIGKTADRFKKMSDYFFSDLIKKKVKTLCTVIETRPLTVEI